MAAERVDETALPGVGARFDYTLSTGGRIGVVVHRDGRREVVVYDADDADACRCVLRLDEGDARTLAELLGSPAHHLQPRER